MPADAVSSQTQDRLASLFKLPKWRTFQASIARAMGMSLVLLDPDGRPTSVCNRGHGLLGKVAGADAGGATEDSLRWLTEAVCGLDRTLPYTLVTDPTGATVGLLPFGELAVGVSAAYLTPHGDYQHPEQVDPNGVQAMTQSMLAERCECLHSLYSQLILSVGDSAELGRHAVVLGTVDLLNSLILKLMTTDEFELDRVLELVANSLVIVLDAPGAWAMSWSPVAGGLAMVAGSASDLLRPLAQTWESCSKSGKCPVQAVTSTYQVLLASRSICEQRHATPAATLWIGVLLPDHQQTRACLESLAAPVAIATAVHGLTGVLRRRIGSLLEAISQPLVVVDSAERVMIANSSARRLFESMEAPITPGIAFSELGLGPAISGGIASAACGETACAEVEHVRGRALRWKCTPLRDEQGAISGVMVFVDDITEVVTFRHRARDWEKLIMAGQLAAGMAHEIRSPLAAAIGAIQLIEGGYAGGREREILRRLNDELARVNQVLSGYLDLGKPAGELRLGRVNVAETLGAIQFLLNSDAIRHAVTLGYDLPNAPVWVTADASALKQVCINLAKNAVEAMAGQGGHLQIGLATSSGGATITFADNGPGIKPDLVEQAFRPFFTTKAQGTGLGLSVSREIVERMGGTLVLESGPGKGVRAVVSLPLHPGPEISQGLAPSCVAISEDAEAES